MTDRPDDEDTARREKLLAEAQSELREVRQQGQKVAPLLARLRQQARENAVVERFLHGIEQTRRRNA